MASNPQEQQVSDVGAPPLDDDAPTPKRGTPIARVSDRLGKATRGLSKRHWSGARFVLVVFVIVLAVLLIFFLIKAFTS